MLIATQPGMITQPLQTRFVRKQRSKHPSLVLRHAAANKKALVASFTINKQQTKKVFVAQYQYQIESTTT